MSVDSINEFLTDGTMVVAVNHNMDCECAACAGVDVGAWQRKMMEKHGWYHHLVIGSLEQVKPCGFNSHTHGLNATYGHLDLEIVFPFHQGNITTEQLKDLVNGVFWNLIKRIKNDEKFVAGQRVSEIISNYDVTFIGSNDGTRDLHRIIFPDKEGNLSQDKLEGSYRQQYEDSGPAEK